MHQQDEPHRPSIIVIGAGVVGLQIAITLLETGHDVVVIADQFPDDTSAYYTSPWAGAQWRTHSSPADREQQSWDRQSYLQWMRTCLDEHANNVSFSSRSGLVAYPAKLIYKDSKHRDLAPTGDPRTSDGFWMRDFVADFQSTPRDATSPSGFCPSVQYRSIFVDVPIYLRHLAQTVRRLGGQFVKAELPDGNGVAGAVTAAIILAKKHLSQFGDRPTICINATGLRARKLCGDTAVHPVRGQVVLVRGVPKQAVTMIGKDETTSEPVVSYVIPRPLSGVTILGGCQQKDNWNTSEDKEMTAQILRRCALLAPELLTGPQKSFEVLGCQVGLRPARTGGARVETEAVRIEDGSVQWIVHAYGHGGAGFQNSIGVAQKVLKLVKGLARTERPRL